MGAVAVTILVLSVGAALSVFWDTSCLGDPEQDANNRLKRAAETTVYRDLCMNASSLNGLLR